jgi:hypothetical protein
VKLAHTNIEKLQQMGRSQMGPEFIGKEGDDDDDDKKMDMQEG